MKNINQLILRFLTVPAVSLCLFGAASCGGDKGGETPFSLDEELTVTGISDKVWTYISLERNRVVGQSPLGDSKGDAEWHDRTDWDFALCGEMIKTNSGSSGIGKGGLTRLDNVEYEEVEITSSYTLDVDRPEPATIK